MGRVHGTSCGQGVSEAHSKMRTFLCIVLMAAVMADSEPYTIGQVAHGYGRGVITGVDYGYGHVSGYGAIGNRGYAGYSGLHGFYGKREADSGSDAYTIGQVAHGHAYGVVTGVDYGMAVSLAMELSVTVAMLAMEDTLDTLASTLDTGVSMVATVASMASVRPILSQRPTPMLTPSARSPTVSPRPMPMPLATPTMSVSLLELTTDMAVSLAMELSVTVAMPAMEDTLATEEPSMVERWIAWKLIVIAHLLLLMLYLHFEQSIINSLCVILSVSLFLLIFIDIWV